jgi:hypothetical protein
MFPPMQTQEYACMWIMLIHNIWIQPTISAISSCRHDDEVLQSRMKTGKMANGESSTSLTFLRAMPIMKLVKDER